MNESPLPQDYPAHRAVHVPLRDGSTIRIRPVLPHDLTDVVALAESSGSGRSDPRRLVDVDYTRTFALVAEGGGGALVGYAAYAVAESSKATVEMAVADEWDQRGLTTVLVEHLSQAAAAAGISILQGRVPSGAATPTLVEALEFPVIRTVSSDGTTVEWPTAPSPEAVAAFEEHDASAAAAALTRFFKPSAVAVIGASRRRGTIGGEVFHNLLQQGFAGPVYPVNPTAAVVQSVAAYPTVLDVPGPVDLGIIVVPAALVADVVRQCGEKGVAALLIISAGFAETGEAGRARQREVVAIARTYGMRIVGPNCMGLLNTAPDVALNATFAPNWPGPGRLSFSSQSGALGIAVIDRAATMGLGLSTFVSVGNKADISGNDLIQYWERDPETDVILLYLESFGNPRKFARIARRVATTKPIVAVKSGRSVAGSRAAASHTASMVASDVAVSALFEQTGVIRTDTLEELFDVASVLAMQPLPSGERVAILTNAGGLGILCADACEASGLEVAPLSDETAASLRKILPPEASVGNPVDMIASASAEQYARALEILVSDAAIDSVIVIFIPPIVTRAEDVVAALSTVLEARPPKPVLACFLASGDHDGKLQIAAGTVPTFTFPESAARALGKVARYSRWRMRPQGARAVFEDTDRIGARRLVTQRLDEGQGWLDPADVQHILTAYGLPVVRGRTAGDPGDAEAAAADIAGPVALKVVSPHIQHKTDVGGVRLDLDPAQVKGAAEEMLARLDGLGLADEVTGFLVQEMVPSGYEAFVGMTHDPSFGPLVACGAGGTMVELLRDVAVRITPLTDVDAAQMLRSLKSWRVFEGYRGQPPLDHEALEEVLLRVAVMVDDIPDLAELDLNPVLVFPAGRGCMVVDARIKLVRAAPEQPRGARVTAPE